MGVPIGAAIGQLLWSTIAESSHVVPLTNMSASELALFTASTLATALALSLWPGHQAKHLHPADILRSE